MYSRKHANHLVCDNCGQCFPESWIASRKAVSEGRDKFCSPFCHEQYMEGTQLALPLGFGGRKLTTTNGHAVKLTRRLQ
jgi:hypothetical protein